MHFRKLRSGRFYPQLTAHNGREARLFKHQGRFIQIGQRPVLDDTVRLHIAEHGYLPENRLLQRLIAAQHHNVRVHAHPLQLFHRMLCGFRFVFTGAAQEGHQCHMNEQAVLSAHLQRDLPCRLYKRLGLDVSYGAADFGDDHMGIGLLSHTVDELLDLVCDMRNHLHGGAEVLAPPFLVQHIPVDLAGGEIGVSVQVFVDKTLIMSQVKVGFGSVLGDIYFSVLIGAHGSGIHIDIRVKLLRRHLQPPRLQQPSQRSRRDSLAQTRYHASRDKYIFGHFLRSFRILRLY